MSAKGDMLKMIRRELEAVGINHYSLKAGGRHMAIEFVHNGQTRHVNFSKGSKCSCWRTIRQRRSDLRRMLEAE